MFMGAIFAQLQKLGVDVICDRCGDHSESILHCLWLCDEARSVWRFDPGFLFLFRKQCRSFFELVEVLFKEGSSYRIALFATIAWGLWQRLNRMRVHQPSWHLHEIGDRAKELVREFFYAHKPVSPLPRSSRCARWVPPPSGCYKANVDAAMFEALDCTGIGVVVRDHEGCIVAALSQRVRLTQSMEMAEALAARRAVVFAKELSLSDVLVEGDCLRVMQALAGSGRCNTLFGQVIEDTRRL